MARDALGVVVHWCGRRRDPRPSRTLPTPGTQTLDTNFLKCVLRSGFSGPPLTPPTPSLSVDCVASEECADSDDEPWYAELGFEFGRRELHATLAARERDRHRQDLAETRETSRA